MESPFSLIDFFNQQNLKIISITKMNLEKLKKLGTLNHGFKDIPFFPTWIEFYERSIGQNEKYPNYMTYILSIDGKKPPIGVLAVQLLSYDQLKNKVRVVISDVNQYLYLSWIALDDGVRSQNYFGVLFDFYQVLLKKLRQQYQTRIEGAAIAIRRMRPILWQFLNCDAECPKSTDESFTQDTKRYTFTFQPSESFDKSLDSIQDHVLMLFKSRH
jgi:hypothetical protein